MKANEKYMYNANDYKYTTCASNEKVENLHTRAFIIIFKNKGYCVNMNFQHPMRYTRMLN